MPIGTLEAIQQGGLVLYACLKAFLPLPSLEVVLIPLILKNPDGWLLYAMEGAVGTAIGGCRLRRHCLQTGAARGGSVNRDE